MPMPHLIERATAQHLAGLAPRCACGDHLGHRLVEVRWFALNVGEICLDCGTVDMEWHAGMRCQSGDH